MDTSKPKVLRVGSTGPRVLALEERLKELGDLKGPADNHFNARTGEAVVAWKSEHGWEDPKPKAGGRLMKAIGLGNDHFGDEKPKTMKGATYNCLIHRNPHEVAKTVSRFAHQGKLDFIQLQEISGYHKALRGIHGYKLITFPGSKDHGESGILVRKGIAMKDPQSVQAEGGWTTTKGRHAQPRAATTVQLAGWLRVASIHTPPGIDWVNGHPVGGEERIKSFQSLTNKLAAAAHRATRRGEALLFGGDWNEGATSRGPGSPRSLAERTGMRTFARHAIDWEMARGANVTNYKRGPEGGSDHNLITFTVTQR